MLPLKLVASDLYFLKNVMKYPEASILQSIWQAHSCFNWGKQAKQEK